MALLGSAVAATAARYAPKQPDTRGRYGYVYGGNASVPGEWDCSSFVSYVLGHDLHLALPGGRWGGPNMPPSTHGPVVESYATWGGATTVGTPQAGDLCCWVGAGPHGHIGIAVSPTEMVSALNQSLGTQRTAIVGTGPAGAPLIYRRVKGVAGAGLPLPVGSGAGGTITGPLIAILAAGIAAVGMFGVALIGAAVVIPWAVSKAVPHGNRG